MSGQFSVAPAVPRAQAFLDTPALVRNPVDVFCKYTFNLGQTFEYHIGGVKRTIVSRDPRLLEHILKDNYQNYHKSEIQMKQMLHFLGPGLLTSHGDYWLKQRRLIQNGFSKDRLAALTAIMHDSMAESLNRFDAEIEKGPVELCTQMRAFTFRMVSRSLFSTRLHDRDAELIDHAIASIQEFIVRRTVQPYLAPWFVLSGELQRHNRMRDRCERVLMDYILARRGSPAEANDLLQILLGAQFTNKQVLNESVQLLVAAHETSSTALSWIIYLLCLNPDYLKRAVEEFETVLGDAALQFSHLPALQFNSQVIDEALRLFPPFWMVDRVAMADDEATDLFIPKGTMIIAFIYGAHHAPEYWEEPMRFYPERFSGENRKSRPAYTYLPFGAGPRGCVGSRYAQLQMLMVVSEILRRYTFSIVPGASIEPRPRIILRSRDGIPMTFRRVRIRR